MTRSVNPADSSLEVGEGNWAYLFGAFAPGSGFAMRSFKELYQALLIEPVPQWPASDDLAELITELLELDSFYAGLVNAGGAGPTPSGIVAGVGLDLERLSTGLNELTVSTKDEAHLEAAKRRTALLKEIHASLFG